MLVLNQNITSSVTLEQVLCSAEHRANSFYIVGHYMLNCNNRPISFAHQTFVNDHTSQWLWRHRQRQPQTCLRHKQSDRIATYARSRTCQGNPLIVFPVRYQRGVRRWRQVFWSRLQQQSISLWRKHFWHKFLV